jgi:hypothetical protein
LLLKNSKGGKIGGPKTCWHADRQGGSEERRYHAEQLKALTSGFEYFPITDNDFGH